MRAGSSWLPPSWNRSIAPLEARWWRREVLPPTSQLLFPTSRLAIAVSAKSTRPSKSVDTLSAFHFASSAIRVEATTPARNTASVPSRRRRGGSFSEAIRRTACAALAGSPRAASAFFRKARSEEHTSELQSHLKVVCSVLLDKKKK